MKREVGKVYCEKIDKAIVSLIPSEKSSIPSDVTPWDTENIYPTGNMLHIFEPLAAVLLTYTVERSAERLGLDSQSDFDCPQGQPHEALAYCIRIGVIFDATDLLSA